MLNFFVVLVCNFFYININDPFIPKEKEDENKVLITKMEAHINLLSKISTNNWINVSFETLIQWCNLIIYYLFKKITTLYLKMSKWYNVLRIKC